MVEETFLKDDLPLVSVKDQSLNQDLNGNTVDLNSSRFVTTNNDRLFFQAMLDCDIADVSKYIEINTINKYKTINYMIRSYDIFQGGNYRALQFFLEMCALPIFRAVKDCHLKKLTEIFQFLIDSGANPLSPGNYIHPDGNIENVNAVERITMALETHKKNSTNVVDQNDRGYGYYLDELIRIIAKKYPNFTKNSERWNTSNQKYLDIINNTNSKDCKTIQIKIICDLNGDDTTVLMLNLLAHNISNSNTTNNTDRNNNINSNNTHRRTNTNTNISQVNSSPSNLLSSSNWKIETIDKSRWGEYTGNYQNFFNNFQQIMIGDQNSIEFIMLSTASTLLYEYRIFGTNTWWLFINDHGTALMSRKFPSNLPLELQIFFNIKQQYSILQSLYDQKTGIKAKSSGALKFNNAYLNKIIDLIIEYILNINKYQIYDPRIKITILGSNLPIINENNVLNLNSKNSYSKVRYPTSDHDRLTLQGLCDGDIRKIKNNIEVQTINKCKTINFYHPLKNVVSHNSTLLTFFIDFCCIDSNIRPLTSILMRQNILIAKILLESGADPKILSKWQGKVPKLSAFQRIIYELSQIKSSNNNYRAYLIELIKTFIRNNTDLLSEPIEGLAPLLANTDIKKNYRIKNKDWLDVKNIPSIPIQNNYIILCDQNGHDISLNVCQNEKCRIIGDFDPINREITRDFNNLTSENVDKINDKLNTTFLEQAILTRDIIAIKKLLVLGANPELKNRNGITMLQLAQKMNSGVIWNLLKTKQQINNSTRNSKNSPKNSNNTNNTNNICYNPSPISLEPYDQNDGDLIVIKFQNKISGWGRRGECITREELKMYLSQELHENRSSSPAGAFMANWVGNNITNTGIGGSAGGKFYFRLPTTNSYITWKSLVNLIKSKNKVWYAYPLTTQRIGNLWSFYGVSMNHGQIPGFLINKLSNLENIANISEDADEYIFEKHLWDIPIKTRYESNEDIDKILDTEINQLVSFSDGKSRKI